MKMTPEQNEAVRVVVTLSQGTLEGSFEKRDRQWTDEFDGLSHEHRQAMFDRLKSEFPNRTPEENDEMWTELKRGFAHIRKSFTGE